MPKMKTKGIVTKRFKVTKNGKVLHRVQGARHLRRKKSKATQRRQDHMVLLDNRKFSNMIKHFLSA